MTADTVFTGLRFVFDCSALLLWGSAIYLRVLVEPALSERIWRQMRPLRIAASWLICAATIAALPVRTAMLGNGWPDAADGTVMLDVLFHTGIGTAWIWQALGALALASSSAFSDPRNRMMVTALAAGFLLTGLATIGHAAMHAGIFGFVHKASDVLHLLSVGSWVGALVPVFLILRPACARIFAAECRIALIRFSTAGHVAVAVALLTGVINTLMIVGGPPTDWSTPYQMLLSLKIAAVCLMLALALANRYLIVPRLSRRPEAMAWLRAGTLAEVAIALAVVGLVAIFGMLEPFP
jgi:putative copper resistance protein D